MKFLKLDAGKSRGGVVNNTNWGVADDGEKVHLAVSQDLTAFIEQNKRIKQMHNHSKGQVADARWHVAEIPPAVIFHWKHNLGVDIFNCEDKDLYRLLDDPDWKDFRVDEGRIGNFKGL